MAIGLQEIQVSIRGGGGPEPTGDAFFRLLGLSADSSFSFSPSDLAWKWARAELFSISMSDVKDAEEPAEAFAERLQQSFKQAASVLSKIRPEGLAQWRASGHEADVFIGGWLANEQFDLELPAVFVAECARLDLSISICTND